jgi:phospholipid/cholesterol/gamma-HCH transport system substrate-binding protein
MTERGSSAEAPRKGLNERELERATPPATGGREVRIGVFVIIGFLSAIILLFLLTDPATFRGRYMVNTAVEDAGGVRRGDPVQMRGVNIGRVHRFELEGEEVQVTLEINGEWQIPEDSHARVTGMGLLGGRTVEVVPGTSETPVPRNGFIRGEPATGGLEDIAQTLGADIDEIMDRINRLASDTTIDAVEGTATDTRRLVGELNRLLDDQRAEIEGLTRSLRASAEAVEGSVSGPELQRVLERADATMERLQETGETLDRASTSLDVVLARMESGEGTLGRLSADDELYTNLNDAAAAILALAEDFRENPSRYIRLRIF